MGSELGWLLLVNAIVGREVGWAEGCPLGSPVDWPLGAALNRVGYSDHIVGLAEGCEVGSEEGAEMTAGLPVGATLGCTVG